MHGGSKNRRSTRLAGIGVVALVTSLLGGPAATADAHREVLAGGLNNPRQLAFSPGGDLYVAESGRGGDVCTVQHPEFGPMGVGFTGAIAPVNMDGTVTRVVEGLPSAGSPEEATGPMDLTFTGNHQYAVAVGLGADPSLRETEGCEDVAPLLGTVMEGDLRANKAGPHVVADIGAYETAENPDGTDLDTNPSGIARSGNGYVVADAGGNAVVSTRKGGSTVAVLDPVPTRKATSLPFPPFELPAGFPADAVPTDVVQGPDGAWYVSQLVGFPFEPGSSTIWRVVPGSDPEPYATGLTSVTSLAFADDGTLYAVELASGGLFAGPIGSLLEITPGADSHDVVAGGLLMPYGVAIRGDHAYVTTQVLISGGGQVVKINL